MFSIDEYPPSTICAEADQQKRKSLQQNFSSPKPPNNLTRLITRNDEGFSILEAPNLAEESEEDNVSLSRATEQPNGSARDILTRMWLRGQLS